MTVSRSKTTAASNRILQVLRETPRHRFLPIGFDASTPDEKPVPLGESRVVPPVNVAAMMLRALELEGHERVLDVGCGSGYVAGLLGGLAGEVVSVEQDDELAIRARATLVELGRNNVRVIHANLLEGWPEGAPYPAILVEGALTELPGALLDQLELGGRLVVPLGNADGQLIERLRRRVDSLESTTIGACRLGLLPSPHARPSSFPWARGRHTEQRGG